MENAESSAMIQATLTPRFEPPHLEFLIDKEGNFHPSPAIEKANPPPARLTFGHHSNPLTPPKRKMASSASEEFLAVPGSPAYSSFRLVELKDSLNAILGQSSKVASIRSLYVHYVCPQDAAAVDTLKNAKGQEREYLEQLLHYGDESSELNNDAETQHLARVVNGEKLPEEKGRLLLFVAPRKGTISPWSSKATSIAHVCGLQKSVKRIERGIVISLIFEGGYGRSGEGYPFADVLYDRMTQVGLPIPRCSGWKPDTNIYRPSNHILLHSTLSSEHTRPFLLAVSTCTLPIPPLSSLSKLPTKTSVSLSTHQKSPTSSTPSPPPAHALAIRTMSSSLCSHKSTPSTAVTSSSTHHGQSTVSKSQTVSSG